MNQEKHEFALFFPELSSLLVSVQPKQDISITDQEILHRILRVLRLDSGEQLILFDREQQARVILRRIEKKHIIVEVLKQQSNRTLMPTITVILPLLKREALEEALYSTVEMGANEVQLILTEKVLRTWGKEREYERCERIMIAAAEQSKHFTFPRLHPPIPLASMLNKLNKKQIPKLFFDSQGDHIIDVITNLRTTNPRALILMMGPEGDLTREEKEQLHSAQFTFCALTPTILRAQQALALGIGIFRSVFK